MLKMRLYSRRLLEGSYREPFMEPLIMATKKKEGFNNGKY